MTLLFDQLYLSGSKLLLTDNNYQSFQSFYIFLWAKIGKIGNYCQFKHQRCKFIEWTLNTPL